MIENWKVGGQQEVQQAEQVKQAGLQPNHLVAEPPEEESEFKIRQEVHKAKRSTERRAWTEERGGHGLRRDRMMSSTSVEPSPKVNYQPGGST